VTAPGDFRPPARPPAALSETLLKIGRSRKSSRGRLRCRSSTR
jgi:hypothetical protein